MRARTVNNKKAYVFDFDDTLVKTTAKTHVTKNGKRLRSLTPAEYNNYTFGPGEEIDTSDFTDPRLIMAATKYKMWSVLESVSNDIKMGRGNSTIYILTARSPITETPIYNFLRREGIQLPLENVIGVGNNSGEFYDIPSLKKDVLKKLSNVYDEIFFYDDSEENIKIANGLPNVRTRLIEKRIHENFDSQEDKKDFEKLISKDELRTMTRNEPFKNKFERDLFSGKGSIELNFNLNKAEYGNYDQAGHIEMAYRLFKEKIPEINDFDIKDTFDDENYHMNISKEVKIGDDLKDDDYSVKVNLVINYSTQNDDVLKYKKNMYNVLLFGSVTTTRTSMGLFDTNVNVDDIDNFLNGINKKLYGEPDNGDMYAAEKIKITEYNLTYKQLSNLIPKVRKNLFEFNKYIKYKYNISVL